MSRFEAFSAKPDLGAALTYKSNVTTVRFGDGYEYRASDGVHVVRRTWQLSFTRTIDELIPIRDFLLKKQGVTAFLWVDPLNEEGIYTCREWMGPSQIERGLYVINATFEEVFEY